MVDFVLSISSQTNVIPPQSHKGHKALTKELLDLKDTIKEGIFVPHRGTETTLLESESDPEFLQPLCVLCVSVPLW